MGLDMYLSKEYYVKNWDHTPKKDRHAITILKGGKPSKIDTKKITNITVEIGYWRKASEIHNWFVQNVQDGADNCGKYDVSEEQLEELLKLAKEVLADHSKAKELLPTQQGFFFGSTDYDEYYFQSLEDTKKMLTQALKKKDDGYFQYRSSW